ncbi:hypothetical protein [Luteolibacter soli]|uniref:HEAT repeat domain-containing protein n=1 Tax=Luteolibacter soli TaxID=3135280 RepID=A0ABU9AV22_9BACT
MRHPWIVLPLVAIAAFLTGRWSMDHPPADEAAAPPTATAAKPTKASTSDSRDASAKRPRPANASSDKPSLLPTDPHFQPGKSRDWLLQQIKLNGWEDDPSLLFRMVQTYAAMDEEEISEMVATYQEIIRNYPSASDAEQAAFPKEWLFKLGLFPALWRYSQLNPDAVLDIVEADPRLKDQDSYQMAIASLAAIDPDRALDRYSSLEGRALQNAMEPILGTLFATDPDRVIQILDDLPNDPDLDGERRKVAERLAADNPQKAIDYALANIRAGRNPDVLKVAFQTWREAHPEEAKRWAATYTGPGAETLK